MAASLTSETDFGQWVTDTLRLEMIKLTIDGDGEQPSGAEPCYIVLCCVTKTHIKKENFTKILRGAPKKAGLEKNNLKINKMKAIVKYSEERKITWHILIMSSVKFMK